MMRVLLPHNAQQKRPAILPYVDLLSVLFLDLLHQDSLVWTICSVNAVKQVPK